MISSVVRTVLVYLAVVVAMRLMGKRQLGELQPAELVTTLLISNVASICIDEPDLPLSASLVPIFLITAPRWFGFARNMPSCFWESR